jgi:hypothetical protein
MPFIFVAVILVNFLACLLPPSIRTLCEPIARKRASITGQDGSSSWLAQAIWDNLELGCHYLHRSILILTRSRIFGAGQREKVMSTWKIERRRSRNKESFCLRLKCGRGLGQPYTRHLLDIWPASWDGARHADAPGPELSPVPTNHWEKYLVRPG